MMCITIKTITAPKYSAADSSVIDVTIDCVEYGVIPSTMHPADNTEYTLAADGAKITNAQIFANAISGQYGAVGAYIPPVVSPAQIAAIAMSAGLAITSTSTPSLNGTYSVGAQAQADITSVMTGVAVGVGLPGGGSSFYWLDATGTPHSFTQAQFLSLATAIRNYVYVLDMYGYGQGTQPAATATIP
jgi:hypothetical protein